MTTWSPEVRVLFQPVSTFRALADEPASNTWTALRRPLLLTIVFGCVVSLQASGRLSLRLITDGVISFAFIPIFESMPTGCATVCRRLIRQEARSIGSVVSPASRG